MGAHLKRFKKQTKIGKLTTEKYAFTQVINKLFPVAVAYGAAQNWRRLPRGSVLVEDSFVWSGPGAGPGLAAKTLDELRGKKSNESADK